MDDDPKPKDKIADKYIVDEEPEDRHQLREYLHRFLNIKPERLEDYG